MALNGSVAIVDDEADAVRTYQLLFERRNIPVSFTALDGPEAVEKFGAADPKPAVMIIDYRLPSMSGLEVMREILVLEPATKILFISGDNSIEHKSMEAGASAFLQKPATIKTITDAVTRLLDA